ncbi:hypothetical protein Taro_040767 [Colocasia esculenta]|uniref:Uncharacterized protein n=1 Tax=Colocasia esculenta TaxID=4460 RepID=A0A843WVH2_COLES|nr:hypothetical protein [Colocasia esculenta]
MYLPPRGTTTKSQNHSTNDGAHHKPERRHHTGTNYWLIRSVSNPDNTTQELPLSLVATDPQSSYGSTNSQVKQLTVETSKHHHLQVTHPAGLCLAPLGTQARAP